MPESWVVIWLVVAVAFAVGEMSSPGSFFLLPFTVGALAAAAVGITGIGLVAEGAAFVGVSVATLAAMRPLARRLDREGDDHGIGSRRLIGQNATVTRAIPKGELGQVRVQREEWRAQSLDGSPITEGATVRVTEVEGTRVMVAPVDEDISPPVLPPTTPSEGADL